MIENHLEKLKEYTKAKKVSRTTLRLSFVDFPGKKETSFNSSMPIITNSHP